MVCAVLHWRYRRQPDMLQVEVLMMYRLTLALLLAGCGSTSVDTGSDSGTTTPCTSTTCDTGTTGPITVAPGQANLCAGTESALGTGYGPFQITGTVIEQGQVNAQGAPVDNASFQPGWANCGGGDARYITVEDSQGDLWHFGWSVEDGSGALVSVALNIADDDPVEVDFYQGLAGGYVGQSSLAVRSGGDLVAAVVSAGDTWEPLDGAALGGLTVTRGAGMGQSDGGVGVLDWWSLDFDGDSLVTIDAGEQGNVTVGGAIYQAYALSAWERSVGGSTTCSDCASSYVSWAVWVL